MHTCFPFHYAGLYPCLLYTSYIHTANAAEISIDMSYCYEGQGYSFGEHWTTRLDQNSWGNIGAHAEQIINRDTHVIDVVVHLTITSQVGNVLDLSLIHI